MNRRCLICRLIAETRWAIERYAGLWDELRAVSQQAYRLDD